MIYIYIEDSRSCDMISSDKLLTRYDKGIGFDREIWDYDKVIKIVIIGTNRYKDHCLL